MKIGLYFGSFNPIHVGHLIIANHIAYHTDCDRVWLVVSPQNPLKPSGSLLNEYDRLYLTELAIGNEPRLKASNIEFSLARPSYTIDTLTYLDEKYPEYEFAIIMGSDSLENLHRWKNYQTLLERYSLYVYKRPGHEPKVLANARITVCNAPLLDISSSAIRRMIKNEKSVRFMIPEQAFQYLMANRYYQT